MANIYTLRYATRLPKNYNINLNKTVKIVKTFSRLAGGGKMMSLLGSVMVKLKY